MRFKTVFEYKILEQISHLYFVGCDISYGHNDYRNNELGTCQKMCRTIQEKKTIIVTKIKSYKVFVIPVFLVVVRHAQ